MLPDKMAISHSNHLFVSVAFVFCLLSSLVYTSGSYDYTDSRQFKKYPAVSRHRNNTRRFVNYNLKPPDKDHSPSEESTEGNAETEFTKPEDPEQRMANPRVKKMQKISRQGKEKWAEYKRNGSGKLALEETTKASELESDESITSLKPKRDQPLDQNETSEKNVMSSQSESDESTNRKNTRRNIDAMYSPYEAAPETSHRRFKDYQISDILEELVENAGTEQLEEFSQQAQNKGATNSRRSFKKLLKPDEILNRRNAPAEKDPKPPTTTTPPPPSLPINREEEDNEEDGKKDEKNVTADSLARKSDEDKDDTGEKDVSRNSQNHEGSSSHSDRWGVSDESSPVEFPTDVSRATTTHQKNKKRVVKAKDYLFARRRLSPPKTSKKETAKRAKSSKAKAPLDDLIEQLKKNIASALLEKSPRGPYNFGYEKVDAWSNSPPDIDLNEEPYLRKLRFLMHVLRSDDIDIPMKCYMRLPFHI